VPPMASRWRFLAERRQARLYKTRRTKHATSFPRE
jgi:hypothetical protein